MSDLYNRLQKQLDSEHKQDAEDCLKIYDYLKRTTGGVWNSKWIILVETNYKPWPSSKRTYKPSLIGKALLKGIEHE